MSHDDATAASGDPFDGVDTASEITEQTGMVSEFTMEREERAAAASADKPATGIEEIKEDIIDEAASVTPSVSTQQEKLKARAQQMAGQAKAVSSRAIESVKSYEQVRIFWDWIVSSDRHCAGLRFCCRSWVTSCAWNIVSAILVRRVQSHIPCWEDLTCMFSSISSSYQTRNITSWRR